jgi:general secretion pathway protein B
MSFILDALKKSENERQRQGGPALFEVKVAAPKPGLPLWAVALAALLVVNIGVVIWLVLRKPAQAAVQTPAVVPQAAPVSAVPPPAALNQAPAASLEAQSAPAAVAGSAQPPPASAAAEDAEPLNPEDYEPAVAPASVSASAPAAEPAHASRGTIEGLPTYDEVVAGGGVPEITLNMHVYAVKPLERFVFLNMQRLREGDSLSNGVRVEAITQDGVVLSHNGTKFVLARE